MATRNLMRVGTLLAALALTLAGRPGVVHAQPPELLDRIVAVVDDEVILWSELNMRVLMEMQQAGGYPTLAEIERRRVLTLEIGRAHV